MTEEVTTTPDANLAQQTNPGLDRVPGIVNGEWAPVRSGDYAKDCQLGRDLGAQLLEHIRDEDNPMLFGTVMRAITQAGVFEGVEIGFCHVFGVELIG